jgi:glycosyltransferase involved in cell wall biosynthesis
MNHSSQSSRSKPTVSVILPARKAGNTLVRALRSVFDQDYPALEIILINNGLNDLSQVFRAFNEQERSLICTVEEPVPGIAHALNCGLRQAQGTYFARMDADDVMLPDRINKQVSYLNDHPQTGLVSGLVQYMGTESGFEFYVNQVNGWITEEQIRAHRFIESPLIHPTVMFRRELIELYGFYSTDSVPEDYELWLRWMESGVNMAKIQAHVINWNDHPGRLSRIHPNYSREAFDHVRYRYLAGWLKNKQDSLPVWVAGGGKLAKRKIKLLEAYGIHIEGILDLVNRNIPGKKFMPWNQLPESGNIFVVSLVSNRGMYLAISRDLENQGYEVGKDYICAG